MNIKSLLLGSAAALAAVSGAQAADAIVAAEPEPMEYVRVCDAFGTGFFYIPGTETCLKIGGYVRFQVDWDDNNDFGTSPAGARIDIDDDNWNARTRALINLDARTDTELGTLRSFIELRTWADSDYGASAFEINEAYFTLGGFKVGYGYNYWDNGLSGETDDLGSNRLNMVGYEYKGDAFSAGIFIDELTGLQDGSTFGLQAPFRAAGTPAVPGNYDFDYSTNRGLGIEAMVSGKFGVVSAQLLGGYDFAVEEGAIRGIVTAGVGPGELGLAAVWASGASAYYDRSEWAVAAQYAAKFGKFTITPGFQYWGNVGYAADGDWLDNDAWRAGVTFDYSITSGLSLKTAVNYTKVNGDGLAATYDDDSWTGFVRLQRTF